MSIQSIYKVPQPRGYSKKTYYIEDRSEYSTDYFDVDYFPLVVGGGRYIIKLKGNGLNMRINSTIDVEILDAGGKEVYTEVLNYVDRFNNYYIAFDIYDITSQGVATAYFVGEALYDMDGQLVPEEYQNEYNVRWIRQFNVFPFERNNADLIFDNPPSVQVAQISRPAVIAIQNTASAYDYRYTTSSGNQLTIVQSNFQGYDRDFASSADILDPRLKGISIDPTGRPKTVNSVPTAIRENDLDVVNGSIIKYTSRFGTIVTSTSSFFTKDMLGGYFEFYNSQSVPTNLQPSPPSGIVVSGSVYNQLSSYNSSIVEVINRTQVVISKPLVVKTIDNNSISDSTYSTHTYRKASNFTASITYVPNKYSYVTSSNVNQTHVEFTFRNLNPISGQVYRIRTSAKLGSIVGDYKLINDQVITPVEYLTDAQFSNGLNYARHESDYRLIGYFTTQSVLDTYWHVLQETPTSVNIITGSINNTVLIDSTGLMASYTQSKMLTTQYYQNYNKNQTYTLASYMTLDPYTEVEIYMNSDPISYNVISPQLYPKAFLKTPNRELTRDQNQYSRFGKYIGKVINDSPSRKYYGRVLFDFETDASGFGRPIYRLRIIDEMANTSGSAYLSEISIKPHLLNGFTPNLVQYAIPLPTEVLTVASLSQSIDFKLDYFDYTGKQSEYSTYLDDVILNYQVAAASNTCQDDKLYFYYYSGAPAEVSYYQPDTGGGFS